MKTIKLIPFILILVGTCGLLAIELLGDPSRTLVLVFAVLNLVGLVILALSAKSKEE